MFWGLIVGFNLGFVAGAWWKYVHTPDPIERILDDAEAMAMQAERQR